MASKSRQAKSRNAASKRFKVTGTGKIMRRHGRFTHLLTKKSSRRKRRLQQMEEVAPGDAKNLRRMLPS